MTLKILRLLVCLALMFAAHVSVRAHEHNGNILNIHDGVVIEVLEDVNQSLTFADILSNTSQFSPFTQQSFNFGLSNTDIWLRITLDGSVRNEVDYIEVVNPYIDEVYAFVPTDGTGYKQQAAGDSLPFSEREYASRTFVFDLGYYSDTTKSSTFYLHFKTQGNLYFLLNLWSDSELHQYLSSSQALVGLYFGLLLIVAIYSLVMCLRLKEEAYCFYTLYMAAVIYFMLSMYGTGYQYFWTDFPFFAKTSTAASTGIFILSGLLFSRVFLHTKELVPFIDRILLFLMGLAFMQVVISYMGAIGLSTKLATMQAILTPIIIWLTAAICWHKGYRPARFLVVAWTVFLASIIVNGFTNLDILPASPVTTYSLLVGSALEVLLISLALSDRLALLKHEKDLLKSAYLDRLEKTKAELEKMVQDRTSELQDMTNQAEHKAVQLEKANRELKELSSRDSLTGLYNHQAFFTYLEQALKSARRYEYYLSVLLIDIDDFKIINDNYGHLIGNEVIKAVANIMKSEIRESDIAARFGGEEFIIVLSHATMTEALEKAEKIRTRIEKLSIKEAEELHCTISTGITTVDWHKKETNLNEVIRVADNAMYEAKGMGKNRIKVAEIDYQVVNE